MLETTIQQMERRHNNGHRNINARATQSDCAALWGGKQLCKLIEELGEAVSAASEVQMLLTFKERSGKPDGLTERVNHLAVEFADVRNMIDQMLILFGNGVAYQSARWDGINNTYQRLPGDSPQDQTS